MSKRNTAYKEDRKCLFPIPVLPVSCQSEEVHIVWQLLQLQRHPLALCVFVSVSVCLCVYLATEEPGKTPRTILWLPQICHDKVRHRRERGGAGETEDCLWGRRGRWLGSNLERTRWELCCVASQGGKMMVAFTSKCTWLFFHFFFFFFSFRFPRKLKVKKRGKYVNASYKRWCNQRFPLFFYKGTIGIYLFLKCKFNSFFYFYLEFFCKIFNITKLRGKKTLNITLPKFYL